MAINNITLGEDQPLSNDLKPIKVGGEASILEISSPLPDGSDSGLFRVDGDLDITGTLKTKLSHDLIYDFDDEVNTLAQAKVDALIDSAPAALDTLNELAAALNDDASFATTVTNSLATKLNLSGGTLTGALEINGGSGTDLDPLLRINKDVDGDGSATGILIGAVYAGQSKSGIFFENKGLGAGRGNLYFCNDNTADTSDATIADARMTITNTGNVGIGTTSPDAKLHIAVAGEAKLDLEDTGGQRYRFFARNSDDVFGIYDVTNTRTWFRYTAHGTIGSTKLALLEGGGNVGIGTTSPTEPLEVWSANSQAYHYPIVARNPYNNNAPNIDYGVGIKLQLDDASENKWASIAYEADSAYGNSGDLQFYVDGATNSTPRMTLLHEGKLGIGTDSPAETLEVVGDFAVRGSELIDNHTFTSDLSDWTLSGDTPPTYVSGNMQMNSDGATFSTARQSFTTVSGVTYVLSGNITVHGSSNKIEIGTSAGASNNLNYTTTGTGTFTQTFTATATTTHIEVQDGGGGTGNTYSEVSVRQIATIYTDKTNNRLGIGTTSPQSALHVEEGDIRIDTAQNGTQALRFSDRNGTEGQLQYNSQYLKLRMLTDAADGTDTKRLTVLGGQDATAVGIGTDDPTTTLDVEGTVSYKSIGLSSSSDAFDVSGATTVTANSASGNIILGGFANGVSGQIIHVIHRSPTNSLRFEHNEATATQRIYTSTSADKTLSGYGGMTLFCDGSNWFEIGN